MTGEATPGQRRFIASLSKERGVKPPTKVRTHDEASDEIKRLKKLPKKRRPA